MFDFFDCSDVDDRGTCEVVPDSRNPDLFDVAGSSNQMIMRPSFFGDLEDSQVLEFSGFFSHQFGQFREFSSRLVERLSRSDVHLRVDGESD